MLKLIELAGARRLRRSRLWSTVIIIGVSLFSSAGAGSQSPPKAARVRCTISETDRAVYAAVLKDAEIWQNPVSASSVSDHTLPGNSEYWNFLETLEAPKTKALFDSASLETRQDFYAKKTKSCYLGGFKQSDLDRSPATREHKSHNSRELEYWRGVIQLSRIGFNQTRTEAIVYTASVCGGLCGAGDVFLLRFVEGKWTVLSWVNVWVS